MATTTRTAITPASLLKARAGLRPVRAYAARAYGTRAIPMYGWRPSHHHYRKTHHHYRRHKKPITGGLNVETLKNPAGAADAEFVKLKYETTSAFTATGGAASYLQIKQNSVYRPYPGNTDSCGGYQRMYAQFRKSCVFGASLHVRIWSATGTASQEPFRIILIPCTSAQYTVYSGYANIAALQDVPHARQALFSPGGALPDLTVFTKTITLISGESRSVEALDTSVAGFTGTSGVDPTTLTYFLVGLQSMAGTTTLNCQIQVSMTYYCKFLEPIAVAVQQLDTDMNFWGNEEVPTQESKDDIKDECLSLAPMSEAKSSPPAGTSQQSTPGQSASSVVTTVVSSSQSSPQGAASAVVRQSLPVKQGYVMIKKP